MPAQIVVAAAMVRRSRLLVAQRLRPPELAGRWELPGGKVAPGETEPEALARELSEELGLAVPDGDVVALNATTVLRALRVRLIRGEPQAHDHRALLWLTAPELDGVDWVPADRGWLGDLRALLEGPS